MTANQTLQSWRWPLAATIILMSCACQVTAPPASPVSAAAPAIPSPPAPTVNPADAFGAAGDVLVNSVLDLYGVLLDSAEPATPAESQQIRAKRQQAIDAFKALVVVATPIKADLDRWLAVGVVPMPPGRAGIDASSQFLKELLTNDHGLYDARLDDAGTTPAMGDALASMPFNKRQAFHALEHAGELQKQLALVAEILVLLEEAVGPSPEP